MVTVIVILILVLSWLLKETDFMRIRLESTEYQRAKAKVNYEPETTDGIPYKPSEFVALDLPELSGSLNIVCQIE